MRVLPITIAAALLLAGCSSKAATNPKPSTGALAVLPSPAATGPAAIGTTRRNTGDGVTIAATVLHVRTVRSRADFGEPGRRFLGVEVRVCLIKSDDPVSLGPDPWTVDYADDTEAQPIGEWWSGEFAQPLYPAGRRVATSQCVRGWIMFKPLKGEPVRVAYAPATGNPVFWRIP